MKTQLTQHYTLLDDLDTRQNEVLSQLDALNGQIEVLLSEFVATRPEMHEPPGKPLGIHAPTPSDN